MLLAYIDESGDPGWDGPSKHFTLAVVLIHESQWLPAWELMQRYRDFLRAEFGIPQAAELKATWLVNGKGSLSKAGLPFDARIKIMRLGLRAIGLHPEMFRVFAVAINKAGITDRARFEPRETAWTWALERLHKWGEKSSEHIKLLPDEGHGQFIRDTVRRMRIGHRVPSKLGRGDIEFPVRRIVEDPSDRKSTHSNLIQMADLCAYAATKHVAPGATLGRELWDELRTARITEVCDRLAHPGIKPWP